MSGVMAFSAVLLLCSVCNVIGMVCGIKPPPMLPWLGTWTIAALVFGLLVAYA